jgi:hypothetical protein
MYLNAQETGINHPELKLKQINPLLLIPSAIPVSHLSHYKNIWEFITIRNYHFIYLPFVCSSGMNTVLYLCLFLV